jgi:hypothetical protein
MDFDSEVPDEPSVPEITRGEAATEVVIAIVLDVKGFEPAIVEDVSPSATLEQLELSAKERALVAIIIEDRLPSLRHDVVLEELSNRPDITVGEVAGRIVARASENTSAIIQASIPRPRQTGRLFKTLKTLGAKLLNRQRAHHRPFPPTATLPAFRAARSTLPRPSII